MTLLWKGVFLLTLTVGCRAPQLVMNGRELGGS